MVHSSKARRNAASIFAAAALVAALVLLLSSSDSTPRAGSAAPAAASEPWADTDVVQPPELAKTLSGPKSRMPLVICVGFDFLYRGSHVPGAEYHGPASTSQGLKNLKKWAQKIPRDKPIVLYCGCCPWSRCPNIRPAFAALHEMGFTHLKVLSLPTDFGTDWLQKGFPTQKGE